MIEGVVSGVVTAAVWAAGLWVVLRIRNWSLERKMQGQLKPSGYGDLDADKFVISLWNPTRLNVLVREVCLITHRHEHIILEHAGPTGDVLNDYAERFEPGHTIRIYSSDRYSEVQSESNFTELLSQTGGYWKIASFAPDADKWRFQKCVVIVEYPGLLGQTRIIRTEADADTIDAIQEAYERFVTCYPLAWLKNRVRMGKGG